MSHEVTYNLTNSRIAAADPSGQPSFTESFGRGNAPGGCTTFADGNGTGAANVTYRLSFSLAANATQTVNLRGGAATDVLNKPVNLTTVKAVYLELDTPGAGNAVRVGPNGNASNANLAFPASGYVDVRDKLLLTDPGAGWPVTTGAGNITVENRSGNVLAGELRVTGVGA